MTLRFSSPDLAPLGYRSISEQDRRQFAEQGWLLVPGALSDAHREYLTEVADEVYEQERTEGRLRKDGSVHLMGATARHRAFAELLDHPTMFPYVWGQMGWNIYSHHNHVDINPPKEPEPPFWNWHQDGYRQNSDLDLDPRPMFPSRSAMC